MCRARAVRAGVSCVQACRASAQPEHSNVGRIHAPFCSKHPGTVPLHHACNLTLEKRMPMLHRLLLTYPASGCLVARCIATLTAKIALALDAAFRGYSLNQSLQIFLRQYLAAAKELQQPTSSPTTGRNFKLRALLLLVLLLRFQFPLYPSNQIISALAKLLQ
jgi:hypothetical protein